MKKIIIIEDFSLHMLKILHTGDVHLDSTFSGLDPRHAEIRRNELRTAFTSMMSSARTNDIDLILIAGDLFDSDFVTRETISLLIREFERFEKPIFISPGNHDPASSDSVWTKITFPKNVHVFRESTLSSVSIPELSVAVYGFGFTENGLASVPIDKRHVAEPSLINLLVCHCDMLGTKASANGCPVTPEQLDSFGADYAALGHVHNPPAPGHDGRWCYCGCLEARAFDEIGVKGACVAEIEKSNGTSSVTIKRVRFSKRRYEKGELALTGLSSQAEVREAVSSYIAEHHYGEDVLLSLRLTGVIDRSLVIDTESLEENPCGLFFLRIEDSTMPDVDFTSLEHDPTVTGELYRILKPSLNSPDARTREVAVRALRYAMSALSGEKTF